MRAGYERAWEGGRAHEKDATGETVVTTNITVVTTNKTVVTTNDTIVATNDTIVTTNDTKTFLVPT